MQDYDAYDILESCLPKLVDYSYYKQTSHNDGGFNALFTLNGTVVLEFTGKGFDGGWLSKGLAIHERFEVFWDELLFVKERADLERSENTLVYYVDDEHYRIQRQERIALLTKECGQDLAEVEKEIPKTYQKLSNKLIKEFMDDVVLKVAEKKKELLAVKARRFGIQGNFVNGKVQPFRIFIP